MKALYLYIFVFFVSIEIGLSQRANRVSGYTKKNGTYVAPHMRTNPNNFNNDNYSTKVI